jgi:hypothetical protein
LSIIRDISGKCSQICTPLTFVLTGLNLPRTSAGASGFMSQVSRWPGEPTRKMVMQFLIFADPSAAPAAWSRNRFGSASVASPADPAVRKLRRVTPEQTGTFAVPMFSIGRSPGWVQIV